MSIWCVIPAFNVSRQLPAVISALKELGLNMVVVNDGSRDYTGAVAEKCDIPVLHHIVNRGQGAALKTGTEFALDSGADIIVHFDGDGQFQASDIAEVIKPLQSGEADIVFGSRFLTNTTKMPWFKRHIIMSLARTVNHWLLDIHLTDPQSGFRAFTKEAASRLDWQQDRMAHCSEILVMAHRQGLRITEVPITVRYTEFGQRLGGGLKILKELWLTSLNLPH